LKRAVALALFFSLLAPVRAAQVVNRTLATVNGESILQSEFEKTYAAVAADMPEAPSADARRENKKRLLDNLIDQKLLLQEAKKRKLRVTQRDLESGLIQVKARFLPQAGQQALQRIIERQMSGKNPQDGGPDLAAAWKDLESELPSATTEAQAGLRSELQKEGLDDKKFEDHIREQLLANQLTQMEVRSRVKPPAEAEVKALFDKVVQAMQGKPVQDAALGEDLGELAKMFAARTGEKVHARHLLIKVAKDASFKDKSTALKKVQDLKKRIAAGEDFAELAEKYSDDKPSAARGGDLGPLVRGQTAPAFEKAAFELPVGKVSDVVETEFGYHLIVVEEKKAASRLRYDDAKDDLADYLMNTRGRDALMGFVKELRKTASIKIQVADLDEIGGK
jgi:peptidyl-prolyl cis-trans isomerase C